MSTGPDSAERAAAALLAGFAENRRVVADLGPLPDPSPSGPRSQGGAPSPHASRLPSGRPAGGGTVRFHISTACAW